MMRLCFTLAMLSLWTPAFGQDCTPQPIKRLASGSAGQQIVPATTEDALNLVPAGMVEVILDASIGRSDNTNGAALEYALLKQIRWGPGSWWFQALATTAYPHATTPVLGWTGSVVLWPGERIGARSGSLESSGQMYVMYTGFTVPQACLVRFLGLALSAGSGPPSPAPDFSALVQAAQVAATALQTLSESVP